MSLTIHVQQKAGDNAQRILNSYLQKCREALELKDAHQAIHESRKQMKKIRAFNRLHRYSISEKKYQMTNTYYRDIARLMSDARDATAMLESLRHISEDLEGEAQEKAFRDIKNHMISRKSAVSRNKINQGKLLDQVKASLSRAEKINTSWRVKRDGFDAYHGGLKKVYKDCQKAMKKTYKKESDANFHDWRKRVKDLRYQIAYLEEVWKLPMQGLEEELHQLTDYLGVHNDLAVLKAYIQQMDYDHQEAITALVSLIESKQKNLRKHARPLGAKLLYEPKSEFVDRIAFYWQMRLKESKLLQAT